jgi:Reverse transcriptase (RNA-dependent DNA polymerase)
MKARIIPAGQPSVPKPLSHYGARSGGLSQDWPLGIQVGLECEAHVGVEEGDEVLRLRTVIDCHERNANTGRLASPLPDTDAILRNVSRHRFRSLVDGGDAYEQIHITPEHVDWSIFTTPDGTMVPYVMQQGDCNATVTYQSLVSAIFAPYISLFMDVYLDDIVIYSNAVQDRVKHVKLVINTFRREKFYLSANKLHFFVDRLKLLGQIVDDDGILMDPSKVDKVANWKTLTNKELLMSFLDAVGSLVPDVPGMRIPVGTFFNQEGGTAGHLALNGDRATRVW